MKVVLRACGLSWVISFVYWIQRVSILIMLLLLLVVIKFVRQSKQSEMEVIYVAKIF